MQSDVKFVKNIHILYILYYHSFFVKKINGGKTARARSKFEERSNKIKQKTGKANQLFLILSLDYPQRPWMSEHHILHQYSVRLTD